MDKETVNGRTLAEKIGVSKYSIRKLRQCGMPCVYMGAATSGKGSRPRYNVEEVRAWLRERSNTGKGVQA